MKTGKLSINGPRKITKKVGYTARVLQKNKRLNNLQRNAIELKTILDNTENEPEKSNLHGTLTLTRLIFSLIDGLIPEGRFKNRLDITGADSFGYECSFELLDLQKQMVTIHMNSQQSKLNEFQKIFTKSMLEVSRILLRPPFILVRRRFDYTSNVEKFLTEILQSKFIQNDQKDDKYTLICAVIDSYKTLSDLNDSETDKYIQVQAHIIFKTLQVIY